MKKLKLKLFFERLFFFNLCLILLFSKSLLEEEKLKYEVEVKVYNDVVINNLNELIFFKMFLFMKYYDIDFNYFNYWFLLVIKLV